jgi:hypothetical protein
VEDNTKRVLLICVAVIAVGFAVYMGTRSVSGPKEEVVGELPMAEGGGRDAERGTSSTGVATDPVTGEEVADVASGMPASMVNPGK